MHVMVSRFIKCKESVINLLRLEIEFLSGVSVRNTTNWHILSGKWDNEYYTAFHTSRILLNS